MHRNGHQPEVLERQQAALQLRKQGESYREIGARLGVSRQQAFRDIQAGLKAAAKERTKEAALLLDLELERLDMLMKGLFPFAAAGDPQAVTAFLKCQERRAKYLGLDAPEKHDHTSGGEPLKGYIGWTPEEWAQTHPEDPPTPSPVKANGHRSSEAI